MYETPMNFKTKIINGMTLVYSDLMELCQGGPEVGDITIDNIKLDGRFGGPVLVEKCYIYIPIYQKTFFKSGFKLARINKSNRSMKIIGKIKSLIYLSHIEGNKIYFFEDVNKKNKNHYVLS